MPITNFMISLYPWLKNEREISEDNFIWEEKELDNSFLIPDLKGIVRLPEGWIVLGWCEGDKLRVLPKPKTIAVLFEENCRRFWVHFSVLE